MARLIKSKSNFEIIVIIQCMACPMFDRTFDAQRGRKGGRDPRRQFAIQPSGVMPMGRPEELSGVRVHAPTGQRGGSLAALVPATRSRTACSQCAFADSSWESPPSCPLSLSRSTAACSSCVATSAPSCTNVHMRARACVHASRAPVLVSGMRFYFRRHRQLTLFSISSMSRLGRCSPK